MHVATGSAACRRYETSVLLEAVWQAAYRAARHCAGLRQPVADAPIGQRAAGGYAEQHETGLFS
jgi:hypothetical protein